MFCFSLFVGILYAIHTGGTDLIYFISLIKTHDKVYNDQWRRQD